MPKNRDYYFWPTFFREITKSTITHSPQQLWHFCEKMTHDIRIYILFCTSIEYYCLWYFFSREIGKNIEIFFQLFDYYYTCTLYSRLEILFYFQSCGEGEVWSKETYLKMSREIEEVTLMSLYFATVG